MNDQRVKTDSIDFFFGEYVNMLRLKHDFTLREFCRASKLDPSNWSKVERGVCDPPKNTDVLDGIAKVLKMTPDEKGVMFDLAAVGNIPRGLLPEHVMLKLPILIRTVRGQKPTEEELKLLWRMIVEANQKQKSS